MLFPCRNIVFSNRFRSHQLCQQHGSMVKAWNPQGRLSFSPFLCFFFLSFFSKSMFSPTQLYILHVSIYCWESLLTAATDTRKIIENMDISTFADALCFFGTSFWLKFFLHTWCWMTEKWHWAESCHRHVMLPTYCFELGADLCPTGRSSSPCTVWMPSCSTLPMKCVELRGVDSEDVSELDGPVFGDSSWRFLLL